MPQEPTYEVGEYVFTTDGKDVPAHRLRIVTGPPMLGLIPCRTVEGTLSLGFQRHQLRRATEWEVEYWRKKPRKQAE